jgi:hypothetical protein
MASMMKKMGKTGMQGMLPGLGAGMPGGVMPPPGIKF